MFKVDLEDGKYTYINDNGKQQVLRYGFPWKEKELAGANFILAMGQKIEELQDELNYHKVMNIAKERGSLTKEDIVQLLSCNPESCKYLNLKKLFTEMENGYLLSISLYKESINKGFTLPCDHNNTNTYKDFDPHKGYKSIKYCSDCGEEL